MLIINLENHSQSRFEEEKRDKMLTGNRIMKLTIAHNYEIPRTSLAIPSYCPKCYTKLKFILIRVDTN